MRALQLAINGPIFPKSYIVRLFDFLVIALLFTPMPIKLLAAEILWQYNGTTYASLAIVDSHCRTVLINGVATDVYYVCRGEPIKAWVVVSSPYAGRITQVYSYPAEANVSGSVSISESYFNQVISFDTSSFENYAINNQMYTLVQIRVEVDGMLLYANVYVVAAGHVTMFAPYPSTPGGPQTPCNALAVNQAGLFNCVPSQFAYLGGSAPWGPDCLSWSAPLASLGENSGQAVGSWSVPGSYTVTATIGNTSASKNFDVVGISVVKLKWAGHTEVLDDQYGYPYCTEGYHYDVVSTMPRNHPVQYQIDTIPAVYEVVFRVLPSAYSGEVKIKSHPNAVNPQLQNVVNGSLIFNSTMFPMVRLPNSVGKSEYVIPWEFSVAGDSYFPVVSPAHIIYRTLSTPSPNRHTVVETACATVTGNTPVDVYDSICGAFDSKQLPRIVNGVPGPVMRYDLSCPPGSYIDLIQTGNGKCRNWQEFFIQVCGVHGINDVIPKSIVYYGGIWPNRGIAVAAAQGQGHEWIRNPSEVGYTDKKFWDAHAIVLRGNSYYDPAYGRNIGSESNAINLVIGYWEYIGGQYIFLTEPTPYAKLQ